MYSDSSNRSSKSIDISSIRTPVSDRISIRTQNKITESDLVSDVNRMFRMVTEVSAPSSRRSQTETITTKTKITGPVQPVEAKINIIKEYVESKNIKSFVDLYSRNTESFTDKHKCVNGNCNDINCVIPRQLVSLKDMVSSMDLKLFYISSGSTGHTFQARLLQRDQYGNPMKNNKGENIFDNKITFAFKVIAYPKGHYGKVYEIERPENVELRIIKLLSAMVLKKETPHLIVPVSVFRTSIAPFLDTNMIFIDVEDEKNDMYREFVDNYKKGKLHDEVSVLVSEWADAGDLMNYIYDNYKTMKEIEWKVIFFQVIYTLARIHLRYPKFRHNDLKANNILLQRIPSSVTGALEGEYNNSFLYSYRESQNSPVRYKFSVPNIGLQAKIWDFDFSCIGTDIKNTKVESQWALEEVKITSQQDQYYDIHYFINTSSDKSIYKEFDKYVPKSIKEFINRIVPEKYHVGTKTDNLTKNGRMAIFDEYTTPKKIITEDPIFEEFRFIENVE